MSNLRDAIFKQNLHILNTDRFTNEQVSQMIDEAFKSNKKTKLQKLIVDGVNSNLSMEIIKSIICMYEYNEEVVK